MLALWVREWHPLSNLVDIIFFETVRRKKTCARKRYAMFLIQLIVKMINGTFKFFIVGRVGTKFNQFACKPHKWSSSSSHQPSNSLHCCYRMSKNIKKSSRLKYKNSCSFHKFTKDKHRIFLPWNWEEQILMLWSLPYPPLRFLFLFRAFWIGSRRLW